MSARLAARSRFRRLRHGSRRFEFGEGDQFPAYWISFDEAEVFCSDLTRSLHRTGALPETWEITLPTEAQWEYACRAGTATATSFGDTLGLDQANFGGDSEDRSARARTGGGAWVEPGWACRSACRLRYEPHRTPDHIGFRVVAVER